MRDHPRASGGLDTRGYDYLFALAKPGFAWEFARRNPALRRAALSCRPGAPTAIRIGKDCLLYRLRRRFPMAEVWGLYWLPDPDLSAMQATPFWRPAMFRPALGLELSRSPRLRCDRLDLARLPGLKRVLMPVSRAPELVLQGDHYAGYFALDGRWTLLPRRFFLRVKLDAFGDFPLQMDAAARLFDVSCRDIVRPWRERAFGPNRLRRALIAYDIRTVHRGSYWDAARAIYGHRRAEQARRAGDDSLRQRVRRAYAMADALVSGGYKRLLH